MSRCLGTAVPAIIVLMTCASAPPRAGAQTPIVSPTYPIRGVIPRPQRFDPFTASWQTRATDHFEIYHTGYGNLDAIARDAERAYARLSADLRHELATKVPLILLPTSSDLPNGRPEAEALIRASGAPDGDHVLLPLDAPERQLTILVHEVSHVFQFDVAPDAPVPGWAAEGFADHETGVWQQTDLEKVRQAVSAGAVPAIAGLRDADRAWGHVLADFVAAEFGSQGLQTFLTAFRDDGAARNATVQTRLGVSPADFDKRFRAYLNAHFGRR